MLIFWIVLLCLQSGIRKLGGKIKHLSLNERPLKLSSALSSSLQFVNKEKRTFSILIHSNHHSSPCKSLNKQPCFPVSTATSFRFLKSKKKNQIFRFWFFSFFKLLLLLTFFRFVFFFLNPIRSAHASNLFVLWPIRHLFNLCSPASSIRTSASNSPGHAVPTKPIRLIVLPYIRISDFSSQTGVKFFYDYSYLPALSTVYQSKENNVDHREKIPIDR